MKPTIFFCLAAFATATAWSAEPEKLSALDAQLLLEKLKELREGSDARLESRYGTARQAFRAAVQSDSATHDLYLKCMEKVRFEERGRKSSEFRDWKRRHNDRGDTSEFRRALRHQLSWLLLTLDAAEAPEKRAEMSAKAIERIDLIFKDADKLEGHQGILRQDALASVFAEAYNLGSIKLEYWVTAPLLLTDVYEAVILPPLRSPKKIAELKQAWEKRIVHEGLVHSSWGEPSSAPGGGEGRPASFEVFTQERRPQLQWEREHDLFAAGDEKGAALRMLDHIEKHVAHKNCAEWISEFEAIVRGETLAEEADERPAGGNATGS